MRGWTANASSVAGVVQGSRDDAALNGVNDAGTEGAGCLLRSVAR
jgi:hypothetical protein